MHALLSAEARRSTDGLQKYIQLHGHVWLAATGLSKIYRTVWKKYEVYKVIKHRWEVFVGVETRLEVLRYQVVFLLDCDTLLQLQSAHRQSLFRFHLHLASCKPKYGFTAPQWSVFFPNNIHPDLVFFLFFFSHKSVISHIQGVPGTPKVCRAFWALLPTSDALNQALIHCWVIFFLLNARMQFSEGGFNCSLVLTAQQRFAPTLPFVFSCRMKKKIPRVS